ncbi:MAG TPA: methyltransferase domain-containing protein [Halioglobus sp.]
MAHLPVSPISPGSEPTQHYDTVVGAWGELLQEDLHYGYFHNDNESLVEATDELTNQMLHLAELREGLQLLDVGCGTGKAACRMAKEYSARVIGISPSEACIERSRSLADASGQQDLASFRNGDGTAMDFGDETFDRVWVMESSHLMQDKRALIRECARVLRPLGRVVLCDVIMKRKLKLAEVIQYRDEFLLLRDVFGRSINEPLQFYRQQFELNGLHVAAESDISKPTFPTFSRWRQNAMGKRESVCEMIGGRAWEQFLLSCDVLEKFWQEDILGYGIISAYKRV